MSLGLETRRPGGGMRAGGFPAPMGQLTMTRNLRFRKADGLFWCQQALHHMCYIHAYIRAGETLKHRVKVRKLKTPLFVLCVSVFYVHVNVCIVHQVTVGIGPPELELRFHTVLWAFGDEPGPSGGAARTEPALQLTLLKSKEKAIKFKTGF